MTVGAWLEPTTFGSGAGGGGGGVSCFKSSSGRGGQRRTISSGGPSTAHEVTNLALPLAAISNGPISWSVAGLACSSALEDCSWVVTC